MELVCTLPAHTPLSQVPAAISRIEALGFDTVHIPETVHDSLAMALLALEHSKALTVRTSMTLAFPRSPMITAYAAWDLARFSGGRFQLGLATQVRGNIVGRFSMPWTEPAAQLEDYLRAVMAIFSAFQHGTGLDYRGTHYRFDRLQPYFNPGPIQVASPQLWTGGVNPKMCRVAGAVADGFVSHPTNSHPRFLREKCLPALQDGAAKVGRLDGGPRVVVVSKCITARSESELLQATESARRELAFLYSTPAYRPTLAMLGHEEVGPRLTTLVKENRWGELPQVLTDRVLTELIPRACHAELPALLRHWYAGLCDGLSFGLPADATDDVSFGSMLSDIATIPTR